MTNQTLNRRLASPFKTAPWARDFADHDRVLLVVGPLGIDRPVATDDALTREERSLPHVTLTELRRVVASTPALGQEFKHTFEIGWSVFFRAMIPQVLAAIAPWRQGVVIIDVSSLYLPDWAKDDPMVPSVDEGDNETGDA